MSERKVEVMRLELRWEPELHFYARISDVDYVLPLSPEHARRLGSCLILLADCGAPPQPQKPEARRACVN